MPGEGGNTTYHNYLTVLTQDYVATDLDTRRVEERLPRLFEDIRSIVEPSGQTDPTFRSTRIYSPLSAEEVRLRLITQCSYKDFELPCIPSFTWDPELCFMKFHSLGAD